MISLEQFEAELEVACQRALAAGKTIRPLGGKWSADDNQCCPLGALLDAAPDNFPPTTAVVQARPDISPEMSSGFIGGFENSDYSLAKGTPAYNLGQKFREKYCP